jgi:hypothetical protein
MCTWQQVHDLGRFTFTYKCFGNYKSNVQFKKTQGTKSIKVTKRKQKYP